MFIDLKGLVNNKFYLDSMDAKKYEDIINGLNSNSAISLYDKNFIERDFLIEFSVKYNGKFYHLLQPLFIINGYDVGSKFVFNVNKINNEYVFQIEKNEKIQDKMIFLYEEYLKEKENKANKNEDCALIC